MGNLCVPTLVESGEMERLGLESDYDTVVVASKLGVSQRTFERIVRSSFGCSPKRMMEFLRLKRALELARGDLSIKEVAALLGYKQVSHFCRRFKAVFKCSFSQFRNLLREGVPLELFTVFTNFVEKG